jgi:hypothetical protein
MDSFYGLKIEEKKAWTKKGQKNKQNLYWAKKN